MCRVLRVHLVEKRTCRSLVVRKGQHVLVKFRMKANTGCDYLATAMHFAAESTKHCAGSNDVLVYDIDPGSEEVKIAYPTALFDCSLVDERDTLRSFLNLAIGNTQGQGLSPQRRTKSCYESCHAKSRSR